MDSAAVRVPTSAAVLFQDGLGERRQVFDQTTNETLEMLCLRGELTAVPAFEFALRERVSRLANFRHAYYGRVRRVDRLSDQGSTLAIVSELTEGARLSEILTVAERRHLPLDINAALCLVRQLVPAVAMLHQNARDVAHGALGPERIVVTAHARLVIVDYVLGAALEQLRYSHERYWKDLRIALPRSAGLPRFDHRADVTQLGVVALSLILGRLLREDEYPSRIADVVGSASAMTAGREPMTPALRSWLARTLQIDVRNSFTSALEAQIALDEVLSDDSGYIAAPVALETFLARYHESAVRPAAPEPVSTSPYANYLTELIATPKPEVRPVPESRPAHVDVRPVDPVIPAPATPTVESYVPPSMSVEVAPMADSIGGFAESTYEHVRMPVPRPHSDPTLYSESVPGKPRYPVPDFESKATENARSFAAEPAPTVRGVELEFDEAPQRNWRRMAAVAVVLVALAGGGLFVVRYRRAPAPIGASVGTLVVESNPPGARVIVDGESRGVTPVNLTLKAGAHVVELRGAGDPRVIPLTIPAGSQISQYIELPKTRTAAALGQLQVRTDPPGARVTVDGVPRGAAPVTIPDLPPGDHDVLLESDLGSVRQHVTIEAAATASLVVPMTTPANAPLSGWVSVSTPVEVQLFEDGRLIGTSQSDRIMVAAGRHEIAIVNDTLGYSGTQTVQVAPGRVVPLAIELPKGTIALNAVPWAEVWIDGERVGETPIGNLPLVIGPHEIIFRNPELGEERHAVTVTMAGPARLSVDLRKK